MTKQVCFVFFIGYFGFIIYYCSLGPTYLIKLFKKNSQIAQIIFRILGEICILIAIAMGAIIDHKIILNIFTLVGISLIIFSVILACIGIYYLRMSSVYMAKEDKLITNGIYTKIRHPQALARILASFGLSMTLNSDLLMWLSILQIFPGFVIDTYIEDREMSLRLGKEFNLYRKKVARFIPKIW